MQDLFESFSKCFGATDTLIECKPKDSKKSLAPHNFGVNVAGNNVIGRKLRKDNNDKSEADTTPRNNKESESTSTRNSKMIGSKMKAMQDRRRSSRKGNQSSPSEQVSKQVLPKNQEISQIFRLRNSSAPRKSEQIPDRTPTQDTDEDSTCFPSKNPPMPLFSRFQVATANNEENPKNSLIVFLASGSHRSISNSREFESRLQHTRRRLAGN